MTAPVIVGIVIVLLIAVGVGLRILNGSGNDASYAPQPPDPSPVPPEQPSATNPPSDNNAEDFNNRFGLSDLEQRLQVPLSQLQSLSSNYRTVNITKPHGGIRQLEIPDDATKNIQQKILHRLFGTLDAHPFACGFEKDTSIVDAAIPHAGRKIVVKMDVRKFFESTTAKRVRQYLESIGWTNDAAELLTRLTTFDGHLPQGAPTSPKLSNLVNAPLDEGLLRLARKHNGQYSRYADDITMSFDKLRGRQVRGITQVVRRILRSYGYTMHGGKKLNILRQHQQQRILGLVVNSQVTLPRKTRRWLRAVKHRIDNGQEASISASQLQGWQALAAMVEKQRKE